MHFEQLQGRFWGSQKQFYLPIFQQIFPFSTIYSLLSLQGWTLALTHLLRQVSKLLSGQRVNHWSLAHLASTIFVAQKLQNKHCFVHSILPRKSLNIKLPFLFDKVLYSKLSNKLVLKSKVLGKCVLRVTCPNGECSQNQVSNPALGILFHALNNDWCFVCFIWATYWLNCFSIVNECFFFWCNLDMQNFCIAWCLCEVVQISCKIIL